MANPIKFTPMLEGKDAERFLKRAANPIKISKKEFNRMMENYKKFTIKYDREN